MRAANDPVRNIGGASVKPIRQRGRGVGQLQQGGSSNTAPDDDYADDSQLIVLGVDPAQ